MNTASNIIDATHLFPGIRITARSRTRAAAVEIITVTHDPRGLFGPAFSSGAYEAPAMKASPVVSEFAFHAALFAVDLSTVPVMSTNRSIPRKEQAALARQLFKKLGLKGISVTAPNYSMAQSVDVRMPKRSDYTMVAGSTYDVAPDCACRAANNEATRKLQSILDRAFPSHDNRSDSQSDYFDYCWSLS